MIKNWKKILIKPNSLIKEALEIINSESLQIVLVVDENKKLLGTVTDGDIRRGLLKNITPLDSVNTIMNSQPITANIHSTKEQLIDLMQRNDILSIPLMNGEKIVGLESIKNLLKKTHLPNPVFIMAGGFGTRLKPLTNSCPKPMLKIGNKPMLETVIRGFIKAGFSNFYISTHYMPEIIKNHFGDGSALDINITYVHEDTPLGTGGALGLLPANISDNLPTIMINGDILTNIDYHKLLNFHLANHADATICVREYTYQIPYGVIHSENNKIISMVEKPKYNYHVNAGIYIISSQIIKSVPKNHYIDMPTLLEKHINLNRSILSYPIKEYWLDIGRIDDFKKAQIDIYDLGIE